jgi:hypothetical protein
MQVGVDVSEHGGALQIAKIMFTGLGMRHFNTGDESPVACVPSVMDHAMCVDCCIFLFLEGS